MNKYTPKHNKQSGFTAVEVVVTLFIGAMFVIAGNQLFSNVMSSGAQTDKDAKASAIAYQYLRSKPPVPTNPCTPGTQNFNDVTVSGLTNVDIVVTVSCPYSGNGAPHTSISKFTSRATYGTGNNIGEAQHATLAIP